MLSLHPSDVGKIGTKVTVSQSTIIVWANVCVFKSQLLRKYESHSRIDVFIGRALSWGVKNPV